MIRLLVAITVVVAAGNADGNSVPNDEFVQSPLFTNGDCGYFSFRLPSLIKTTHGVLLAFSEARLYAPDPKQPQFNDSRKIDLVLRRSLDGGKSWLPVRVVMAYGQNTCSNPCSVVDRTTGTVFLLWTLNFGDDNEGLIREGKSRGTRTVWVTESHDDGQTWSPSRNITATAKAANWAFYATGPGTGIQTTTGRLIVPCDHSVMHVSVDKGTYQSHVIYSDDHGVTWNLGGTVGPDTNECQVAQLPNGSLMISMRNRIRRAPAPGTDKGDFVRVRAVSLSEDEGLHWEGIRLDPQLPDPVCEGSLISYSTGGGAPDFLLFSNPSKDGFARADLSVKVSATEGKTWRFGVQLCGGDAGYSSLCEVSPTVLGCLYERDTGLTFCEVPIARILSTVPSWERSATVQGSPGIP
jgi:sialidase-1